MVFSSITFIYYFLPIVLLIYFITPNKFKNFILLISSLLFYFYGEPSYIWVLLLSCFINYISALLIEKYRNKSKIILILTILLDLGILMYFKYTNFFIENINSIFGLNIKFIQVIMPIGISFFTFQTLSYVIDVYTKKVEANKNILVFSTYVSLFPQLIAGPIVRYIDVEKELKNRKHSCDMFAQGIRKFTIGLGKKVLIANVLGEMINILNNLNSLSVFSYILIAIGFTLQIYFDFSGYSDMAIGLGKIFGFNFLENFNYPYIANSITDFWRRWHISLSSFLKDYVYIPLGGNRIGSLKQIKNIFIVWFLTGFWHGAAWNFIIWGLYFSIILIFEKKFLLEFLKKHKIFSHIYTMFLVTIGFIIFNANSFSEVIAFMKSMLGFNGLPFINQETLYYFKSYIIIIIISIIASTPLLKNICIKLMKNNTINKIMGMLEILFIIIILMIVTAFLIDSSFNPFLYFRF